MNTQEPLWSIFCNSVQIDQAGGLKSRFKRWRHFPSLILQKMGFHCWVKASLFFGENMWTLTGETISKQLLAFGYTETALTAFMLQVIKPEMKVVDIGAHLGYEALLASKLVGHKGRVISFEPQLQINKWTFRNLAKFPQARVMDSAVGEVEGEMNFFEMNLVDSGFSGSAGAGDKARLTRVIVAPLGKLLRECERPVDFIKCDVEGAEMSVLRGAVDVIKSDNPIMVLEGEMATDSGIRPRVNEFINFLEPLGYVGVSFDFFDGELRLAPICTLHEGHANVAFVPQSKMGLLPYPIS